MNTGINTENILPPVLDEIKVLCIQDIDNVVYGPFSKDEIIRCIAEGRLEADTKVNFKVGRDKHGTDTYAGWMKFGKAQWKYLLPNNGGRTLLEYHSKLASINVNINNQNSADATNFHPPKPTHAIFKIKDYQQFWFLDNESMEHGPFYGSAVQKLINKNFLSINSPIYIIGGKWEWSALKNFIDELSLTGERILS